MPFVVRAVQPQAILVGQENGKLDLDLLTPIMAMVNGESTLVGRLLPNPARAWNAMVAAAAVDGIELRPTSMADTFRSYAIQETIFRQRYSTSEVAGFLGTKRWNGQVWYQRPHTAMAAVPGTSNHGWANAVDVANASGARLMWMVRWAETFGWSWETQSEPWHLRYVAGDQLPAAVLAHEMLPVQVVPTPIIDFKEDPMQVVRRKAKPGEEQDQRVYLFNGMTKERMLAMSPADLDPNGNPYPVNRVVALRAAALGISADVVDLPAEVINYAFTLGDD